MIVRRLAARRLVKAGSTAEDPRRRRAARFLVLMFAAGAIAGLAAWLDVWPFGNVQAVIRDIFAGGPSQIAAQAIFPTVKPVQKVVDVYDSPRPTHRPAPAPQPPPDDSMPSPTSTPRPTEPPDD